MIMRVYQILLLLILSLVIGACKPKGYDQANAQLSSFRILHLAMQTAILDGITGGDDTKGWPADVKYSSVAQIRRMLVDGGYLSAEDQRSIDFSNLRIGNVSDDDPLSTTFLVTREPIEGLVVLVRKGGDGNIVKVGKEQLEDPPRTPAYLD
jgi:hypothetical protein